LGAGHPSATGSAMAAMARPKRQETVRRPSGFPFDMNGHSGNNKRSVQARPIASTERANPAKVGDAKLRVLDLKWISSSRGQDGRAADKGRLLTSVPALSRQRGSSRDRTGCTGKLWLRAVATRFALVDCQCLLGTG
jgi:hypothetical protein